MTVKRRVFNSPDSWGELELVAGGVGVVSTGHSDTDIQVEDSSSYIGFSSGHWHLKVSILFIGDTCVFSFQGGQVSVSTFSVFTPRSVIAKAGAAVTVP